MQKHEHICVNTNINVCKSLPNTHTHIFKKNTFTQRNAHVGTHTSAHGNRNIYTYVFKDPNINMHIQKKHTHKHKNTHIHTNDPYLNTYTNTHIENTHTHS